MQFAVKRLSSSDLTFFEYQFRRQNDVRQKAINLNRNVFVDLLFPLAAQMAGGIARQFPLPVSIYGPGLRNVPHVVTRKVIAAGGGQKNWRLNGEFVPDPDDDPNRYHGLAEHDLVAFGFEGDGVPTAFYLVLLARSEPDDAGPFGELESFLAGRSMAELPEQLLSSVAERSPAAHPIRELLETERDQAMQEAALGSAEGAAKLLRRPSFRRMTAAALANARETANAIGRNGEVLVNDLLRKLVNEGKLIDAHWISETNAVNPWDFEITELSGDRVRIEVKSTNGSFERTIHISHSEILAASEANAPRTDLYRVYALSSEKGLLRIKHDIKDVSAKLSADVSAVFPDGFVPDGYSAAPSAFGAWSEAQEIKFTD